VSSLQSTATSKLSHNNRTIKCRLCSGNARSTDAGFRIPESIRAISTGKSPRRACSTMDSCINWLGPVCPDPCKYQDRMYPGNVSDPCIVSYRSPNHRGEISLAENNKFHVLVTMSCAESVGEREAVLATASLEAAPDSNLSKNEGAPIVAIPTSLSPSRPPLDIICVLDTSGSMSSDNKLTNLLFAGEPSLDPSLPCLSPSLIPLVIVNYIRGELSEFDRMAVITFENSAVVVHQLLRMNDQNKIYTSSLCQGLRPGGGTSILAGLQAASTMILQRQSQNPITSVFLLTDGVDGSHVSEKKVLSLPHPSLTLSNCREFQRASRSLAPLCSSMGSALITTVSTSR
jgi:hypothetical protein